MIDYSDFLKEKEYRNIDAGFKKTRDDINPLLFDFQNDITRWAVRKGKAAIFADTGLGKTFMQLEWARLIDKRMTLIVAPLAVAQQTVDEAKKIDLDVYYCRNQEDTKPGINITNYEMIERFDPTKIEAVVLDESSILKSISSKTRKKLIQMFQQTPYRLCCTATPSPNDFTEIGNHCEFLGVMKREEMLATFFVHDDKGWRLKGHATEAFWKWMVTWALCIKKPSDLGYDDAGFILPRLVIEEIRIKTGIVPPGKLFHTGLKGIQDRIATRQATLNMRIEEATKILNENDSQAIAWVGLNEEGRMLHRMTKDSVLVEGSQSIETKTNHIRSFLKGDFRTLISKPRICGFGMNFQNASKVVFVGLGDSFEQYYQCTRRSWRYGQKKEVHLKIILADIEDDIISNIKRKERDNKRLSAGMVKNMKDLEVEEIREEKKTKERYESMIETGAEWEVHLGDCVDVMRNTGPDLIDLSVFSPPFISLYTYTDSTRDMGNSRDEKTFFTHMRFSVRELLRITKPGRIACCHVSQVPAMLVRDGWIGMKDFRGKTISLFEENGWFYHGEVCIDKDPQAQAIRTHSKALLFAQLKKDSSWLRPALADYILVFRKPGENNVSIKPDLTNNQWIEWARPIWYGIRESDTLSVVEARSEKDERHICPLQLGVIERCVKLWSNIGETVLDPFAGIGSVGYEAVRLGRRAKLIELKREYFAVAVKNLKRAENEKQQGMLF